MSEDNGYSRKKTLIVNGEAKNLNILYGKSMIITYDTIVKLAGYDPNYIFSVTYSILKNDETIDGILSPYKRIAISDYDLAVFDVADTSNA